uniref:Lipoprotein n=1 Tax=Streptomyces sp. NBC_00008 TaxID=2903610 RepID=A0AAU2VUX4_9ACTN
MNRSVRLLESVLLVVVLAACQGKAKQEEPAMDMQQAGQRSEAILDGTMAVIHPSVKWARGTPTESPCSTGLNRPTGTTTVVRSRNILTVVSEQRRGELLEQVRRYWEQQGFRDFDVDHDKRMPQIRATTADELVVTLEVGSIGNVFITAGFGCAEDSEMSYPAGTPGQPGGPKKEELTPREHSDFWSSGEVRRSSTS